MTHFPTSFRFQRTLLALAVCAAFTPVQAQTKPTETVISIGAGAVSGSADDRALFGQYNDLHNDRSAVGLLGIDYSLRQPDTSSWVDFHGSNLLGDTRELNLIWKNPGSWKFTADYGQLVHSDPNRSLPACSVPARPRLRSWRCQPVAAPILNSRPSGPIWASDSPKSSARGYSLLSI